MYIFCFECGEVGATKICNAMFPPKRNIGSRIDLAPARVIRELFSKLVHDFQVFSAEKMTKTSSRMVSCFSGRKRTETEQAFTKSDFWKIWRVFLNVLNLRMDRNTSEMHSKLHSSSSNCQKTSKIHFLALKIIKFCSPNPILQTCGFVLFHIDYLPEIDKIGDSWATMMGLGNDCLCLIA